MRCDMRIFTVPTSRFAWKKEMLLIAYPVIRNTAVAAILALGLAGCSGMNSTQQRTVSGGAGVGALGTLATGGCVSCGTAIGAGVGAAGGYVYDQLEKGN